MYEVKMSYFIDPTLSNIDPMTSTSNCCSDAVLHFLLLLLLLHLLLLLLLLLLHQGELEITFLCK